MKHIKQKLIGIGYIALALIVGKFIGEWGCLVYAVPLGLWLLLSRKPYWIYTIPSSRRTVLQSVQNAAQHRKGGYNIRGYSKK